MSDVVTSSTASASTLSDDNPWPGLLAFRESDQQYFQGRRVETEALQRLVLRERLTVLFGLSGLGKSSLLQAGLFPRLRAEQVFPVYIRLDYSPAEPDLVAQVWDAVQRQGEARQIEVPEGRPGDTLWARFHRTDADFWNQRNRPVTPLLVFDQFEEIFTLGRRDAATRAAADRLIDELSDLAEGRVAAPLKARLDEHPEEVSQYVFGDHRYKILVSIREDFLPELETLRGRLSGIALNRLRLERMNGLAGLDVINQAPHLIDPDVAEQVVRFVAADRDARPLADLHVEPALLSVVARELNTARRQRGLAKITPDLLKGSQDEVLATFYERSVGDLPPDVRTFIEDSLLTVSGYRDSVALENALTRPGVSRASLDRLVERRLIRIDDRSGAQRVELTHDLLTGVVRTSRDQRRQIEQAERDRVAREEALAREQVALRQLRRSRQLATLFLAISVAALVAAAWAVRAQREARRQRGEAAAAQASSYIQDGVMANRSDQSAYALAHFAAALRADPSSIAARSWVTSLLRRAWWVPSTPYEHDGPVSIAVLSPDGKRLVTGAADVATVWDTATRRPVGDRLRPGISDARVRKAVFAPDGRLLTILWERPGGLDVGDGSIIMAVDPVTGRLLREPLSSSADADNVAVSADGRRTLSEDFYDTVRVIDVASGSPVGQPLGGRHGNVFTSAFSPDGGALLTLNREHGWRLWDASTGALRASVGQWNVGLLGFTADGRFFMWTGTGVVIRETDTGTIQRTVPWATNDREIVQGIDPKGERILSVDGGTLRLRDSTGAAEGLLLLAGGAVQSAWFSGDGRYIIALVGRNDDVVVRIWNAETRVPVAQALQHGRRITSAALSADARRIATASEDGAARIWDLSPGGDAGLRTHGWERAAGLSGDGRRAAIVNEDNSISVFATDSWTMIGAPLRPQARIADVALSPDGRWMLSLDEHFENTRSYDTRFWDLQAGRQTAIVADAVIVGPTSDRFSETGRVAVSRDGRSVDVFDLATGRSLRRIERDWGEYDLLGNSLFSDAAMTARAQRARLSPDGGLVFTGEAHAKGLLWDVKTGGAVLAGAAGDGHTSVMAFSADGARVAAATNDVVRVWDLVTQRQIGQPHRNDGGVSYLAFSPDGRTVVSAYGDTAQAWDVATGRRSGEPMMADSPITSIAVSPDSRRVVAAGDKWVQLWELGRAVPIGAPLMLDMVFSAQFMADGQHVLVHAAREIVVWQVLIAPRSDEDVGRLAALAEEVSGFRFNEFGSLVIPFGDDGSGRRALREWAEANATADGTDVASFVREFLADLK